MSQRDNDLMESVAADDQAILVPASPPRRDSMEDADSSLTRKRPRLDDGSTDNHNRAMTNDPSPSPAVDAPQVEMTIRSQPASSTHPGDDAAEPIVDSAPMVAVQDGKALSAGVAEVQSEGDGDLPADSPPVVAVDEDGDDDDEDEVEYMGFHVAYDEEDYFRQFPFATPAYHGDYMAALHQIIQHFQGSNALEGTVLPQISIWLNNFPHRPSQWKGYFLKKQYFWDEFALLVSKVIGRRYPFGETFCDDEQTEDEVFYVFFSSYTKLCARLLQLDADLLSKVPAESVYDQHPLSYKHLKHLNEILTHDKSPVFQVLFKEYRVDIRDMRYRLMNDFFSLPTNGSKHLFKFASGVCHRFSGPMKHNIASWTTTMLISFGWYLYELPSMDEVIDFNQFKQELLQFTDDCNEDLQDPGKVLDVNVIKELVSNFTALLADICQWDDWLAVRLADNFLDFGEPNSPTTAPQDSDTRARLARLREDPGNFPALVSNAWRFKLLRKYVVKGRMELRVASMNFMDEALVNIWREYHGSEQLTKHPVMQYLADFLLHHRVVDYIISVDSHPQIISRSGNIVGFLVVTHRYSEAQTDAIWTTLSNSPDPRVVSATLKMVHSILTLMDVPEALYCCAKLHDLPIESYTLDTFRYFRELTHKLQTRHSDWSNVDRKARPWNVCIRLIQDASPSRESTPLLNALSTEACEQLQSLIINVDPEERRDIYTDCATHIASGSPKATGSIRAIYTLCSSAQNSDVSFFQQDIGRVRAIIEEFCNFVESENRLGFHPAFISALQYRLDLLRMLAVKATEAIPTDLYLKIWDHSVGKHALNNHVRDMAWSRFSDAVKWNPDNDFCRELISSYVTRLEPDIFTPGLYDFVASYRFPTTKELVATADGDKEVLQIRGAELLWRLILTAPQGTIEDQSARLLAARYVEIDMEEGVTLKELEEAHVALVKRCTKDLLQLYSSLRVRSTGLEETVDDMDVVSSDNGQQQTELRFSRTLLFEKLLLMTIRGKPEFCRSQRSDSKIEIMEPDTPLGDSMEIKYNISSTSEKQTVLVGSESTLQDLYMKLCFATGFTKINMFAAGQKLNLLEKGQFKLAEIGLGPRSHLLVQKAAGSETRRPVFEGNASRSVFETTLLEHVEELFACMDSDDYISGVLYDFLTCFPFREGVVDYVMSGHSSSLAIFPPGKLFQAKYAAIALQYKLREQIRRSALDETFLLNAVQLLNRALLDQDLLSDSLSNRHELHLASVLVGVLLEFLKERPRQEASSCYFPDEMSLVHRLLRIIDVSLGAEHHGSQIVISSYATILEASLHSRGIWTIFVDSPATTALHRTLLLTDSRKQLRQCIVQSIASVCGGDLPSTTPLTGAEIAAQFWTVVSAALPNAIQYPTQSEQLFDIAEQVFRSHDENSRDEEALRSSLKSWSDLLLHHEHEEYVGREEVDFVVFGFTKLLTCCILSLKSFKKPLSTGPLMGQLFRKFLFVPKITELDEDDPTITGLPVLESRTRKELYDLILSLAEDRNSYDTLLSLAESVANDEETISLKSYSVDRANEIRSLTGYVGLVNPRAICYMNSLLTQLFMNINFRKFMLGLDVADAGASQRLLSETQKLFATMQNTFRKSADPRDFAFCVKGLDSQPIDINIQMDADEFYNLLFDQWEGQMLSPQTKQQFRSFYGGQTVNQIKSKECEHVSERVESFFVVQCDVQGKTNLQESLQAFVQGDVMEGDNKYKCESCGGKFVDAVKRTCLKDVPDNLIFHLKRFDFDLVDMRRTKINDQFAFPDQIDVSLYNIDHLSDPSKPRKEDIFELVGVLVHQGTSENGHYYSYIRERPSADMPTWVEFNDRDVDKFDHDTIAYHAFGGIYDEQYPRQQKQFSAYMLFYQRKAAIAKDHRQYISSLQSDSPKVPVPSLLETDIKSDNEAFVREYSLHDPNHSKFIRQILTTLRTVNHGTCSEDHQQETRTLNVVLEHLCQTIARQRNIEHFDETMIQLRKTVLSCSTCCYAALKWLASHDYALIGLLLRCLHMKIRSQMRAFLIDSLRFLREKDPALYGIEAIDTDMETGVVTPIEGILVDIVLRLRTVADESWISARGWDDFYLTLCQISDMGHVETAVLLNHEMLEFCLRVLSMHAHANFRMTEPDIWRLVEKKKHIYNRLIELVYTLLSKMDIRLPTAGVSAQYINRLDKYDRTTSKFPLTHYELDCLRIWDEGNRALAVLDRMIETFDSTKTEVFYPGEVLQWLLQSREPQFQRMIHHTMVEGIGIPQSPYCDPYVRAALHYCSACSERALVAQIIDAVVKSTTEIRETGGEVHLQFFTGLLTLENETISEDHSKEFFINQALLKSRAYVMSLLLYDDDLVRRTTANFLGELFRKASPDHLSSEEHIKHKYIAARRLIVDLNKKIVAEFESNISRSYMQPMIQACQQLVELLFQLTNNEDPVMSQFKNSNDMFLIQQWHGEVQPRLRRWHLDEGTPISTGEAYEHSDYGSESDEGPDIES